MEKKFELTENYVVNEFGTKLYQIKCIKTFKYAEKGELGGFIEKEENLSQKGNAWVYDDAQVYGNARVYDNALVYARVCDNAHVYGKAKMYGAALVYGDTKVCK